MAVIPAEAGIQHVVLYRVKRARPALRRGDGPGVLGCTLFRRRDRGARVAPLCGMRHG